MSHHHLLVRNEAEVVMGGVSTSFTKILFTDHSSRGVNYPDHIPV